MQDHRNEDQKVVQHFNCCKKVRVDCLEGLVPNGKARNFIFENSVFTKS